MWHMLPLKCSLVKSIDRLAAYHEVTILLTDNQQMLAEKHDEKLAITLLIVGAGMIVTFGLALTLSQNVINATNLWR